MTTDRVTTADASGTMIVEDGTVTAALGALAWAKGFKLSPALWKGMISRKIDISALEIETLGSVAPTTLRTQQEM